MDKSGYRFGEYSHLLYWYFVIQILKGKKQLLFANNYGKYIKRVGRRRYIEG